MKMWLSPRLYKLLPVAYLLSGLLMLVNFGDTFFGLLSGSMFAAAAILIWALRIHGARKTIAHKR